MGWHELEANRADELPDKRDEDKLRAIGAAAKATIGNDKYAPLRDFLMQKAHAVSYRPGMNRDDVSFHEGQRSLALQLLKLAGEI